MTSELLQPGLFSPAFEYSPNGMALVSPEGKCLRVNSSLCQMLGYAKSELYGKNVQDITHPDDWDNTLDVWNRLLDGKTDCCQMNKRLIHKNGSTLWVLLVIVSIEDEHKQPLFFGQIKDITQNKLAEEELQVKTEQLESFIENNADAIWMIDAEDILLKVNPAFETLFGWSAEEVKGMKLPIIPDYLKDSMHIIHQGIKAGETVIGFETIRQRKDGTFIHVEATLSPLRDRSGSIIGITGICRDVTARKRAEEELQAKTEQLESFIENNADAIWMIDAEDTLLKVNPAFETLFGWPVEEVKGRKLPIIPDFFKASMESIHQGIKAGTTIAGLETIRQRKDGALIHVEATLSPLRDRSGKIIGITGICRDVTARKRAEEELKAKTEQLESYIENNADTILIFNNNGVVLRTNEAFKTTFGWSVEEIVGVEIEKLPFIPADRIEELKYMLEQVKKGQSIVGVETVREHKNGGVLNVILTASPILDGKGNQLGWSATLRNITEWKIAQDHLQNSEKLSVAGQLAAGIAHEIRNPITAIKGFIQLMKSGFQDKPQYYDIMFSEIERIELIVSELLVLAKPQSVKYERKDIRVLISQVMTLLDSEAVFNNVQFATEYKPGFTHLVCDENQLKQVFINFIKNSIDSMPNGGKITIEINGNHDRDMTIRLIDQGCGMPKELLSKLGQPFYTTKENGTGLGFMVSKKIIENHSGKVRVESEVNKGTIIEITLPIY